MHKVCSPVSMEKVLYKVRPNGVADVFLRNNEKLVTKESPENGEVLKSYEADEVYCRVKSAVIPKTEIAADFDFWFSMLSQIPDIDANELGIEARRAAKMTEVSQECEKAIVAGIDVMIGGTKQHFSLTVHDQLNLFGKQAQISAGALKCEYHNDGNPCKFYTADEMKSIITAAMKHVSMQTTYCNSLYDWIKSCRFASEIEAIHYGDAIPQIHQSEVLAEYLREASV